MNSRTRGEANFVTGGGRILAHELHRMRELTREEAGLVGGGVVVTSGEVSIGTTYIVVTAKAKYSESVSSSYSGVFSGNAVYNLGGSSGANG